MSSLLNNHKSVADEIANIRHNYPNVSIQSATNKFMTASYQRTPYTRIKLTLTFPDGYPKKNHLLIVDVASDEVVPPGLKKKLDKDLAAGLNDLFVGDDNDEVEHYDQVEIVIRRLIEFVDKNKFLPCWKGLKQCIHLVRQDRLNANGDEKKAQQTSLSSINLTETEGKIKLKLQHKAYHYSCTLKIDDGYPSTTTHENWGKSIVLKVLSTNLPPKIETILTSQGRELVRRMQDGMSQEDALRMSNPVKMPAHLKEFNKEEAKKVQLTQSALKGLKKDLDTLSQVRDLREIDSATVQGNAKIKANNRKDRHQARRMIKKITKTEITKDEEQERRDVEKKKAQWQSEEKQRIMGFMHDRSDPQPSLLSLVTFLKDKIQRLPEEKCPCCANFTLSPDPKDLQLIYMSLSEIKTEKDKKRRKDAKAARPIRTYCGCWWHYDCLHKFMTEPPFGAACPTKGCGRRVFHPDWPDDIKQLERAYSQQQARKREIEDAAMFL